MRISIVIVLLCLFNLAFSKSTYTKDDLSKDEELILKSIEEIKMTYSSLRVAGSEMADEIEEEGRKLIESLEDGLSKAKRELDYLF